MRTLYSTLILALLVSIPSLASGKAFQPGDRVMANGSFHRKCAAKVLSLTEEGKAILAFDHDNCGEASKPYSMKSLSAFHPVNSYRKLHVGDSVVLNGFMDVKCSGKVGEINSQGFVAVKLDSFLCADSAALHSFDSVKRVSLIEEATLSDQKFMVGKKVSAKAINGDEPCNGKIRHITDNGYAAVEFEALTCAYGGKLYSLEELTLVRTPKEIRQAKGEEIFNQVMREIASARKAKKQAQN